MQVFIYDLNNGKRVKITDIVADAMGVDVIPEDSAEAIQIGADYAVETWAPCKVCFDARRVAATIKNQNALRAEHAEHLAYAAESEAKGRKATAADARTDAAEIEKRLAAAAAPSRRGSVFIVNLFLGWTFIGWVIALFMAIRSKENAKGVV
ncbi:hypothetical protein Q3G72_032764 [Acer saccharum]|nr:hypothetical protein Q3G72_032764 [Acer saccharum]